MDHEGPISWIEAALTIGPTGPQTASILRCECSSSYLPTPAQPVSVLTRLLAARSNHNSSLYCSKASRSSRPSCPATRRTGQSRARLESEFTRRFKSKTRTEWEAIFDGVDACVTPVLSQRELEKVGYQQRPIVTLDRSPAFAIATADESDTSVLRGQGAGVEGQGWLSKGLKPGHQGEETLTAWLGWKVDRDYRRSEGGLVTTSTSRL